MTRARVITVSDRSFAGTSEDRSGPLAVGILAAHGVASDAIVVVPDETAQIAGAVQAGIDAGCDLVLTTGGTGISPRDVTPEAVAPLIERSLPGVAEAMRSVAREAVPTSILSRGVAGVTGSALIVTLPGSTGGVRDGLAILLPVLEHIAAQLRGSGHDAADLGDRESS